MNIFGEGFPKEVLTQIENRQKIYGSGLNGNLRTPEQVAYLNSKTSWCKLASGVDIDNPDKINNPIIKGLAKDNITNNELAKRFVLFNGTADEFGNSSRAGVGLNNNIFGRNIEGQNTAYGIGGTDFGLRPMMGIQYASIRHESRGSIRRAEVKIKAFNKYQFDIVDSLYLRLGFTVLLEWGHSIIVDDKGNIDTNPVDLSLSFDFIEGKKTYDEFLQLIFDKRLSSYGNYDAMLAKVSNFTWSFLPDGSYDITVYLISIGDIIESLKINTLVDSSGTNNTNINEQTQEVDPTIINNIIDSYAYTHNIGNFLFTAKTICNNLSTAEGALLTSLNPFDEPTRNRIQEILNTPNSGMLGFDPNIFKQGDFDILSLVFTNLNNQVNSNGNTMRDRRYYIRLGSFLNFLEKYIIPYYYNKDNKLSPSLKIDYDENTNLMNIIPIQVSVDPTICYVNHAFSLPKSGDSKVSLDYGGPRFERNLFLNAKVTSGVTNNGETYYGNIMNIYLDFTFILSKIEMLKDDKNNLALVDFLQGLLKGINEGLGGINDLDVFIDETNNTIRIIDKNPLKNLSEVITILNQEYPDAVKKYNNNQLLNSIDETKGKLQLYGYHVPIASGEPTLAGFIKEFDLKTEISPNLATMITVGATSRGAVVGENDTALSKLNAGFLDRYKKSITNDLKHSLDPEGGVNLSNKIEEYKRMFTDYIGFLQKLATTIDGNPVRIQVTDSDIQTFKGYLSSLLQKATEIIKVTKTSSQISSPGTSTSNNLTSPNSNELTPTPLTSPTDNTGVYDGYSLPEETQGTGFLPFNLSLTMDGLSGIKINQQFYLDTTYMPSNYPETLRFLIRNLSHEIRNNKWTTKIETYSVSKSMPSSTTKVINSIFAPLIIGGSFNIGDSISSSTPIPPSQISANAEVVYRFFISKGFKDYQAAAWVGNLQQESRLNPTITNSIKVYLDNSKWSRRNGVGDNAYGLAQWAFDRKERLLKKPNFNTLQTQLNFIWEELQSSKKSAFNSIKATSDLESAVLVIRQKYEVPGEVEAKDAARLSYAATALKKFRPSSQETGNSTNYNPVGIGDR